MKLDVVACPLCLKHMLTQIEAQTNFVVVAGTTRVPTLSQRPKVNRVMAHPTEETQPQSATISLQKPQTLRINTKHLPLWKRIMCYQCGSKNHLSRVCQDSTRVVAEYHSRHEKLEINFAQVENPEDTKMDLSNFHEAYAPMED